MNMIDNAWAASPMIGQEGDSLLATMKSIYIWGET